MRGPFDMDAYLNAYDGAGGEDEFARWLETMQAPPQYEAPRLASPQPLSGMERMGMALSQVEPYRDKPYESGASAFLRALLTGAARGYGTSVQASLAERERRLKEQNEQEQARAAHESQMQRLWYQMLPAYYRAMNPRETPAKEVRMVNVPGVGEVPETSRVGQEYLIRKAGLEPPRGTAKEKDKEFQWTAAGANRIRAAERVYEDAKAGKPNITVTPEEAKQRLDALMKNDFAAQLRSAKTLEEAESLASAIVAQFPGVANSPMIRRIAADKRREFGAR